MDRDLSMILDLISSLLLKKLMAESEKGEE